MSAERIEEGQRIRREMFGDELVTANYDHATPFQRPVQDWLASAVWGEVWSREGLDRRTRSLMTIAMLAALGRTDELIMHVGAAPRNGCSVEDIQEALLQVAPYAGAPAALSAFRIAEDTLRAHGVLGEAEPSARKGR